MSNLLNVRTRVVRATGDYGLVGISGGAPDFATDGTSRDGELNQLIQDAVTFIYDKLPHLARGRQEVLLKQGDWQVGLKFLRYIDRVYRLDSDGTKVPLSQFSFRELENQFLEDFSKVDQGEPSCYAADSPRKVRQIVDPTILTQWDANVAFMDVHDGKLYVAHRSPNEVRVYDTEGVLLDSFSTGAVTPKGIAVSPGRILVTDDMGSLVHLYDHDGTLLTAVSAPPNNVGVPFRELSGVAYEDGFWYVVQSLEDTTDPTTENRVRVLVQETLDEAISSSFGNGGSADGELDEPQDIAVLNGVVYVTDYRNNRVNTYSNEGLFRQSFGSLGHQTGNFRLPRGIAADYGKVLVADQLNNRYQVFGVEGNFLYEGGFGDADLGGIRNALGAAILEETSFVSYNSVRVRKETVLGDTGRPSNIEDVTPLTVMPPADQDYIILADVVCYSEAMDQSFDNNWLTINRPDLLTVVAHMQWAEANDNTELVALKRAEALDMIRDIDLDQVAAVSRELEDVHGRIMLDDC